MYPMTRKGLGGYKKLTIAKFKFFPAEQSENFYAKIAEDDNAEGEEGVQHRPKRRYN